MKSVRLLWAAALCGIPGMALANSGGNAEADLMLGLLIIVGSCLLMAGLMHKVGFPSILGQILAGAVVGNLGITSINATVQSEIFVLFGSLGLVLLMFEAGLEGDVATLKRSGLSSLLVALLGVVVVGGLGYGVARALLPSGTHWLAYVFVACALTPTSAGIPASLFGAKGQSSSAEGTTTLGAAVFDDILGLVILAILFALGDTVVKGTQVEALPILMVFLKALGFLGSGLIVGRFVVPHFYRGSTLVRHPGMVLAVSLVVALAFSWGATLVQLAPLIGAYVGGLVLEKAHYHTISDGPHELEEGVKPLRSVFAPVFFFLLGMKVPAAALLDPTVVGMALAFTAATFAGKVMSGLGVVTKGTKKLPVIFGMMPRGEVAAIMVQGGAAITIGGQPLISPAVYTSFVLMIAFTTLVAIIGLNKVLPAATKQPVEAPAH